MKQFSTPLGQISITPIVHATVLIEVNGKNIYIDPSNAMDKSVNPSKLPKADLICITHDHFDHFDKNFISHIRKPETFFISSQSVSEQFKVNQVLTEGQNCQWENIKIEAVPAYNIIHMKSSGHPFHPKGFGLGLIFNFGDFRVYIAGDTENIPEMQHFGHIDVAFLPLKLPYTMDDEMVIQAAKVINPTTLFIYHCQGVNKPKIQEKLPGITVF